MINNLKILENQYISPNYFYFFFEPSYLIALSYF